MGAGDIAVTVIAGWISSTPNLRPAALGRGHHRAIPAPPLLQPPMMILFLRGSSWPPHLSKGGGPGHYCGRSGVGTGSSGAHLPPDPGAYLSADCCFEEQRGPVDCSLVPHAGRKPPLVCKGPANPLRKFACIPLRLSPTFLPGLYAPKWSHSRRPDPTSMLWGGCSQLQPHGWSSFTACFKGNRFCRLDGFRIRSG